MDEAIAEAAGEVGVLSSMSKQVGKFINNFLGGARGFSPSWPEGCCSVSGGLGVLISDIAPARFVMLSKEDEDGLAFRSAPVDMAPLR